MTSRKATDSRTFIRVHDDIENHPKAMLLSDRAFRVLIETWGWNARNRTDGFVREAVWERRAPLKVRRELEAEMVHRPGHSCGACPAVPVGFVLFHDYLGWQSSAEEISEKIDAKKAAGMLGNHRRWHEGRSVSDPDCPHCLAPAIAQGSHPGSQNDRKTSPDTDVDVEERTTTPPGASADAAEGETLAPVHPIGDRKADDHETEFAAWWSAYPRKASRAEAFRAYVKARKGQKVRVSDLPRRPTSAETLLEGAQRYAAEMRRTGRAVDKIAHGSTWLNGDRWTDETGPARVDPATLRGPVFEGA